MSADAVINLNVGGRQFSTSRHTLTWLPDTFFSSLLSGRIGVLKDDSGAIFIDRDPDLFAFVLNYLRTKTIDIGNYSIEALKHEAQYYNISPLVKRLTLCEELVDEAPCGDVLFHAYLNPPSTPTTIHKIPRELASNRRCIDDEQRQHNRQLSEPLNVPATSQARQMINGVQSATLSQKFHVPIASVEEDLKPTEKSTQVAAKGNSSSRGRYHKGPAPSPRPSKSTQHTRTQSADFQLTMKAINNGALSPPTNSCHYGHAKREMTRQLKLDVQSAWLQRHVNDSNRPTYAVDPLRVKCIRAHHNWIVVAYENFAACYRMKDSLGWMLVYVSDRFETPIKHVALNVKMVLQNGDKMLAISTADGLITLGILLEHEQRMESIGHFTLGHNIGIDRLFFIGSQLVALSRIGKVGIWNAMTMQWQSQAVVAISSFDTAGSFLLLGCTNGAIYYIDMQKFPLRLKDNDLLVTELYRDPQNDVITSISVYLTPKTNLCGNWIEIAYGTSSGSVRVIVQHPETVGHGPQLFQTFTVHRAPIIKVALTTHNLISVCSEYNHVRSWSVTRFRGMISTQPGSHPLASFKVLTLDCADDADMSLYPHAEETNAGPFGDQDGEQLFVQKVVPDSNILFVRLASNGDRICRIAAVDGSAITTFAVHECEGSNRMGSRPRRYLFTGHSTGAIQMWDLTTALENYYASMKSGVSSIVPSSANAAVQTGSSGGSSSVQQTSASNASHNVTLMTTANTRGSLQGPSLRDLLQLIDECEIISQSMNNTPLPTPAGSNWHINK